MTSPASLSTLSPAATRPGTNAPPPLTAAGPSQPDPARLDRMVAVGSSPILYGALLAVLGAKSLRVSA